MCIWVCFQFSVVVSFQINKKKTQKEIFKITKNVSHIQAKPIVDTIEEHEKYGNDGDKFFGAGRAIINTFENISNVVNKLIDVSFRYFNSYFLFRFDFPFSIYYYCDCYFPSYRLQPHWHGK